MRNYFYLTSLLLLLCSCGIYKFNDAALNPNWKTVKLNFIENKASYINPQLAQKLNDKLQQKITNSTKLTRTRDENADLVIGGTITGYDATQTVSIGSQEGVQQSTTNRLTVTMRMAVRYNTKEPKDPKEFSVSRSFDYSAKKSLQQAEGELLDEVVRTITDEIFNQIFSEW